ncbi:hypothetical protein [Pseudomonas syringae group sp. J309-1]|uniref:hypothetical protein n=1 Tax=Pseudomonas syringae group sp. J309-1 TaxID=3079588 RepID=UPI00291463E8|nr:hypothetical protein [Pseudomonas syringae group sp. J309-1]MDU8360628.1 hypothetical protein [Pseudomonas syringae group sp. J309-1]
MAFRTQAPQEMASLSIDSVFDSQGVPVSDGGFTRDPALTLSGAAVDTGVLEVLENGTRKIVAWPENGTWSAQVQMTAVGSHSFTVRSIDNGTESEPWGVIASWNEPLIEGVVDSQGVPVSDGGFTRDPELILSGASVDTQVMEILDNGTRRIMVWPEDDTWSAQVDLIIAGSHSFIARSIDNGAQSEPWMINASWNEPRILGVVDSQDVSIPDGGFTREPELTLSGDAVGTQVLEILDNGTRRLMVWPEDDTWSAQVDLITAGSHSFIARSIDTGAESTPWIVSASWHEPVIEGVVDSQGVPVPDGGSTPDTLLTLSGTVVDQTRPDVLDILDNDLLTVRAFPFEGGWEAQLRGLTVGGHSFTARSNNNSAVSEPWVITVTTS